MSRRRRSEAPDTPPNLWPEVDDPNGKRQVRVRVHVSWRKLALGAIVPIVFIAIAMFTMFRSSGSSPSAFPSAQDIARLEKEHAANPDDLDVAMRLAQAYLRLATISRSLDALEAGTRDLLEGLSDSTESDKLRKKLDKSSAKARKTLGLESSEQATEMLDRGTDLVAVLMERDDLSPEQKAALYLVRGGLLLQQREFKAAMRQANQAASLDSNSPGPHMLKADIFEQQKQYSAAIDECRRASRKVTKWASRDPGWGMQIVWSMGGPARSWRLERDWRRRRERIAATLRQDLQVQVSLLRNLDQLKSMRGGALPAEFKKNVPKRAPTPGPGGRVVRPRVPGQLGR